MDHFKLWEEYYFIRETNLSGLRLSSIQSEKKNPIIYYKANFKKKEKRKIASPQGD